MAGGGFSASDHGTRVHGWEMLHTSSAKAYTGVLIYLRWLAQPEDKGRLQSLSAWIWFKVHTEMAWGSRETLFEVENETAVVAIASHTQRCFHRSTRLPAKHW